MPENLLPLLTAYLWDLRAQCESQLRSLTAAQRLVDEYRDAPHPEGRAKAQLQLQQDLQRVVQANAAIRESAQEAVRHAEQLPPNLVGTNGAGT